MEALSIHGILALYSILSFFFFMARSSAKHSLAPLGVAVQASTCGHSACSGETCHVHYVGPTSHLRDHYMVHAARGASHVWPAAIVSGLAILLTGVFVHAAVIPSEPAGMTDIQEISAQIQRLSTRLERLEMLVDESKGLIDAPPVVPMSPVENEKL